MLYAYIKKQYECYSSHIMFYPLIAFNANSYLNPQPTEIDHKGCVTHRYPDVTCLFTSMDIYCWSLCGTTLVMCVLHCWGMYGRAPSFWGTLSHLLVYQWVPPPPLFFTTWYIYGSLFFTSSIPLGGSLIHSTIFMGTRIYIP